MKIPHGVVKPLVDRYLHFYFGRGVTESNDDHDTPLMEASCNGDTTSVFMLLLHAKLYLSKESEVETEAAAKAAGTKDGVLKKRNIQQEFMDSADDRKNTSLHAAAGGGHPSVLQLIIESTSWTGLTRAKPNVNARNSQGMTPLHWAAFFGHTQAAKLLLEAGANIEACDDKNRTPMSSTAMSDAQDPDTIRLLAESGANVLHADERGKTPLHLAVVCDKESSVRALTELQPDGLAILDEHGFTPFATACFKGSNPDIVRFLHESGSDLNTKDVDGRTPLHTAAQRGNVDMLRLLAMDLKANVNTQDKSGWTPLQTALVRYQAAMDANNNNVDDDDGNNDGGNNEIRNRRNDDLVEILVKSGADIEMKFRGNSMNTLHIAVQQCRVNVVSMLLKHARRQRRLNKQNVETEKGGEQQSEQAAGSGNDGDTSTGAKKSRATVASAPKADSDDGSKGDNIIEHDDDGNIICIADYIQSKEQNHGYTALHFAAMFCTDDVGKDMIKVLVEAGADIDVESNRGITPLQIAIAIDNTVVAEYLALLDLQNKRRKRQKKKRKADGPPGKPNLDATESEAATAGAAVADDASDNESEDDSTNETRRKRVRRS